MGSRFWFMYLATFAVFTIIMQVGESSSDLLFATDVNDSTAFQVDKISSGSGFFGTMRSSVSFLTATVPKLMTFNYSFLSGDLEIIRWFLIFVFGGLLVIMLAQQMLGILQRNI